MPKKTFRQRPKGKTRSRKMNQTVKGGTGSQDEDSVDMYLDDRGGVHYTEEAAKAKNEFYRWKDIDRKGRIAKKAISNRRLQKKMNDEKPEKDRLARIEARKAKEEEDAQERINAEQQRYASNIRKDTLTRESDLRGPPPPREIKYNGNYVNAQIDFLATNYFNQISERQDLYDTDGKRNLEQNKSQAIQAGRIMFDNDIEEIVKPEFNKKMDKTRLHFIKKDRTLEIFLRRDLSDILELFERILRENIDIVKIQQEIRRVFMTPPTQSAVPSRSWKDSFASFVPWRK